MLDFVLTGRGQFFSIPGTVPGPSHFSSGRMTGAFGYVSEISVLVSEKVQILDKSKQLLNVAA